MCTSAINETVGTACVNTYRQICAIIDQKRLVNIGAVILLLTLYNDRVRAMVDRKYIYSYGEANTVDFSS